MYQLRMFHDGTTYKFDHTDMNTIKAAIKAQSLRFGLTQIRYVIYAGNKVIAQSSSQ